MGSVNQSEATAADIRPADLETETVEMVEVGQLRLQAMPRLIPSPPPDRRWRPLVRFARWRWGKLAAMRAKLDAAEDRCATLEQEIAGHIGAFSEAKAEHAKQLVAVEAQADERVEVAAGHARERADRAAAETTQRHDAALAAMRAKLDATDERCSALEREVATHLGAMLEAETQHATALEAVKTQAAAQLEAVRRDADTALTALRTELQRRADARVEAVERDTRAGAERAAAETAQRHEVALAAMRTQLDDAVTRAGALTQELTDSLDALREAKAEHAGQLAAIEAKAAEQLESTRRDADRALEILGAELEAKAAARVEAAVGDAREAAAKAAAETAQKHGATLGAMRAELTGAGERCASLERDVAAHIKAMRDAEAQHATQLAAVEAQAAAQLETVRRDADTALTGRTTELEQQATARVEAAVRDTQEAADRAAAETAQQHQSALETVLGQLHNADLRRRALEQELAVAVSARRKAIAAVTVMRDAATELEKQATDRLEATVRDIRQEAARAAGEAARQHEDALGTMRTRLEEADTRCRALEHELALQINDRLDTQTRHTAQVEELEAHTCVRVQAAIRETRDEAASAAALTAQRHETALAGVRTLLEDSVARRGALEEEFAAHVRAGREAGATIATRLITLEDRIDAASREGEAALALRKAARADMPARQVRSATTAARRPRGQRRQNLPDVFIQVDAVREGDSRTKAVRASGPHAAQGTPSKVVPFRRSGWIGRNTNQLVRGLLKSRWTQPQV